MKGITVTFKNKPNVGDQMLTNHTIKDCLIAQNGSPTTARPQIIIHLPKDDTTDVSDSWVEYEGSTYHVIGSTAPGIAANVPTRWNRYVVAEKIY